MAAIFKIPQFSWQPQSEYISGNYSMRRKKWCVIHEIISKTHRAASMWSYPYIFFYKALVFQANFLDSSLSSSGYISETNDRRATKICQGMGHDMATWGIDVESQRSKIKVIGLPMWQIFKWLYLRQFLSLSLKTKTEMLAKLWMMQLI